MNAKRLFEDDEILFGDPSDVRASHVELRIDSHEDGEPASTERDLHTADDYYRRIPQLAVDARAFTLLALDHREGFLVSRVDGESTVETILDVCAMPADEALEILESLVLRGVLLIPR